MSEIARLRIYRFEPGTVFEGGLVGAIERMELGGDAKLLDAGNDALNWPHCDGLNWPRLRPIVA